MSIPTKPLHLPSLPWPVRTLTTDDLDTYRVTTITERLGLAALIAVREHAPVLDPRLNVLLVEWGDLSELLTDDDRTALWRSWSSMPMLKVEILDREATYRCRWDDCPDPPCRSTVLVFVSAATDWQALATALHARLEPLGLDEDSRP